ncbi:AraC family transcriptional regulator [Phreatobacter sp. AB_2022a]|uniref:AraC family transcriptional regulator n=1 Tax=Phreatobacter sp. AB_2022a TaxID=3003134 RepID=UPI002287204D|nr:AraC family transcriptional regulator [Phreatobacter sp. AB_2022a]MCZ0735662.1 AraC family transcriptional regulator ligand-binding domain-containing protein [Phreatobacter sp. AB_2022a]
MQGDPKHLNVVRAAALAGFGDLVSRLGGDPTAILRSCALDPAALADPDRSLPYRNVTRAIDMAARNLATADFGLRLCALQDVHSLGLLALVMQSASSVREAMMLGARYVYFHNSALGYRSFMDPGGELECLEVFQRLEADAEMLQVTEICVSYQCRLLVLLSGGAVRPAAIHFRHAPIGSEAQYCRHLGQMPRFNAAFDGVSVNSLAWRRPLPPNDRSPQHNQLLQRFVGGFLMGLSPPRVQPVADQVRNVLGNLVRTDMTDLGTVARVLGQHPRALQRRLKAEGAAFEDLRDAARKEWARQLLLQQGLGLAQVADLLGFADQSVLTRACQRWFGATPKRLRRNAAAPLAELVWTDAPPRIRSTSGTHQTRRTPQNTENGDLTKPVRSSRNAAG